MVLLNFRWCKAYTNKYSNLVLELSIDESKIKIKHGRVIAWIVDRIDGNQLEKQESSVEFATFYFGRLSNYINDPEKKYLGDDETLIIKSEV